MAPRLLSLVPFSVTLVVVILLRVAGDQLALDLAPELGAAFLLGAAVAPLVAASSYASLRDPRLYVFSWLAAPLLAGVYLHTADTMGSWDWLAAHEVTIYERRGELTGPLLALALVLLPALAVAVTFLPANLPRQRLRTLVRWGALGTLLLASCWVAWVELYPRAGARLLWLAPLGAGAAVLWRWDTPSGFGGAVAGLLVWLAAGVSALAPMRESGALAWEMLGLEQPTEAVGRLLVYTLPLGWGLAVAYEWLVRFSYLSQRDALTQVWNKAYAEAIVSQASRTELGPSYSVACVDIDHFKQVNDRHGHGAGDEVLKETARAIVRAVGDAGVVCRTGGEELTIFFPRLELADAQDRVEAVRAEVQSQAVPAVDLKGKRLKIEVTVSGGVASNIGRDGEPTGCAIRDVLAQADEALYAAKRRGRNRVVTMHELRKRPRT